MIDGVLIEKLSQFPDERGKVMHMLRCTSPHFQQFGEIYFSVVNPGAVKAWKLHKEMTLNLAVPSGNVKLVLYDVRSDSPTQGEVQEIFVGEENYSLVQVPSGIWSGFQGLGQVSSMIANCATMPYDPEEVERLEANDSHIPYQW